jgi:hypothetical protein
MVGLEEAYRKSMLPVLEKQEKGTAVLDVSSFKEPLLIDIPYTTVDEPYIDAARK